MSLPFIEATESVRVVQPSRTMVSSRADSRAVLWAAIATFAIALFGLVARLQIMLMGLARPGSANIFFRLYALHELPFLLVILVSAGALAIAVARAGRASPDAGVLAPDWFRAPTLADIALVSLVLFVATLAITHLVLHAFPFSMDEFSADFQARLFARGQFRAQLPDAWRPFAGNMTPIFVGYSPDTGRWLSVYLPVYALLKAPFVKAGAASLLNPLLAGGSMLALGACARRLWPGEGLRPWLAIALLATSSQFLITSGTAYSMPAHLCLNLLWLWLYLRGDARSWGAALVVGVLALGLHNPFPHALFVAPFLIRLLLERRWARVFAAAAVYGLGSAMWLGWFRLAYTLAQGGGGGLLSLFAMPTQSIFWLHAINLSLLFTWQSPVLGVLVVAALCRPRHLSPVLTDLALGVALTLCFFLFFPTTQGHGWGYRYAYQVLGSLVLIAAAGVDPLRRALGDRPARAVLAGALALALGMQIPLRLVQTERFVRPFAAGAAYVASRDADVVLVHGDSIWYGRDLVRNDPFLSGRPVVVYASDLSAEGRAVLEREHPGRVAEVRDSELLGLGMTPWFPRRR